MGINKTGNWNKKRKLKKIPEGKNIKFYYCGECTEPEYFNFLAETIKQKLKKESSGVTEFNYYEKVIPVDPKKMAKTVQGDVEQSQKHLDEIFVIFDKDSFKNDNFDNAILMIEEMNKKYSDTLFYALWSNECLEIWFLLHFEFIQSQVRRQDYFKKLKKHLKLPKYEKNLKDLFKLILNNGGSIQFAIENAHKLLEIHRDKNSYSDKNPATNVVTFFDLYFKYFK